MEIRILYSAVAFFMIIVSLQRTGFFQKIITGGLCLAIFLSWIENENIRFSAFILFNLSVLLSVYYGATQKHLLLTEKVIILTAGIIIFLRSFFGMMHWPGAGPVGLFMILPVLGYIYLLINKNILKSKEAGFLTLLIFHCMVVFIQMMT